MVLRQKCTCTTQCIKRKLLWDFYNESFKGRNDSILFSGTHNLPGAISTPKEKKYIFKKIDIYFPSKNVLEKQSHDPNLHKKITIILGLRKLCWGE